MSTLRTRIVSSMAAFLTKSVGTPAASVAPLPLSVASDPAIDPVVFDWPHGTSTGQASKAIAVEQGVNSGGFNTIDMTTQVDRFGDAVVFSKLKAFQLHVVAGTGTLTMSGTFNPWKRGVDADVAGLVVGDVISMVRPAGLTIDASNKTMTLGATGGTVTVRVIIVGD